MHLAKQRVLENTEHQLQSMKNRSRDKQRATYELSLALECGRAEQLNLTLLYSFLFFSSFGF